MNKLKDKFTIKELPLSERPYEKLEQFGPQMLSNAELLAIIIRTGSRNETSVALAQRLMKEFDSDCTMSFLKNLTMEQLQDIKGIGRVKAIQLLALTEISKRMSSNYGAGVKPTIKTPQDIANILMEEMRHLRKETFKTILLNTKNNLIKIIDVSVGSLSSSIAHPREVFVEAVKASSAAVAFVHNHPSGDPNPSSDDIMTTKRLSDAGNILGIKVLDHVIIGDGRFVSLKEQGYI